MDLKVLLTEAEINAGINRLAEAIRRDFGDDPLHLVGVLKGSVYFLADLSRELGPNVTIDFVQVSSYGGDRSSSGIVKILKDVDVSLEGRHVLIVEDIIDTGATLSHLREMFWTRRPKSLGVVTLLSKPEARRVHTPVEYVGFEIPNEFVVGYGLDEGERYRNLPWIAILPPPDSVKHPDSHR